MAFVRALALVAVAAFAATAHAACFAPQLSDEHINRIAKDIAAASLQLDSSSVILRLTFTDPGQAPAIETIYAGGDKRFAAKVVEDSGQLRSDCASPSAPASTIQMARLSATSRLFGRYEPRVPAKIGLAAILKSIKTWPKGVGQLDTRQMGCPSQLVYAPFMPYLPNLVIDAANDPRRARLIAWLRSTTPNISDDAMPTAIGQQSTISVPCMVVNIP